MPRLIRDLDLLIGICLAVIVAVLGVSGIVSTSLISAATLLVLALTVSVFFRVREQLQRVEESAGRQRAQLQSIQALVATETRPSNVFRYDYPDLGPSIEDAAEIWVIAGGSLRTTVGSYLHQFQHAIERGAVVRLVCPDPTNRSLMEQLCTSQATAFGDIVDGVSSQLRLAQRLVAQGGTCEIRVAGFLPSLGIVKIVPRAGSALLFVKLLPFSYVSGGAPVCLLNPEDGKLYEILESVLSRTWDVCPSVAAPLPLPR